MKISAPICDPEANPVALPGSASIVQLKLEDGRLKKQSYIRLQHTYRVPASMLRQYAYRNSRAYKRRLTQESYSALMARLAQLPEKYEVTGTLYETKNQRLLDLARSTLPPVVRTRPVAIAPQYEGYGAAPAVFRTPQAAYPVSNGPQYGGYGTLPVVPQAAQYLPPSQMYPARSNTQQYHSADDDTDGECSLLSKFVVVIIVLALIWWMSRDPSV